MGKDGNLKDKHGNLNVLTKIYEKLFLISFVLNYREYHLDGLGVLSGGHTMVNTTGMKNLRLSAKSKF